MAPFIYSSFGTLVMTLFQGIFTAPSWQTFTALACGWTLAGDRHTITTYVWRTGAAAIKHFARFSVVLGRPLSHQRWHLWGAVIRLAAQFVPAGEVMRVRFDDTTKKKAGPHSEGLARYRHGAGSARQEYRTVRGVHVVLGVRPIPRKRWPGHSLSLPVGLALYLKEPQAHTLHGPYRSRRQLARDILDCMAAQLPGRPIQSLAAVGYATKDYGRRWPKAVPIDQAQGHRADRKNKRPYKVVPDRDQTSGDHFPALVFTDPALRHLSQVIFSAPYACHTPEIAARPTPGPNL